jgi:predicted RNase H-like HicB family nuclease
MTERRWPIVIEGADDANHSAYAPDLPGVAATGATREECERAMQTAIAFHLEGLRDAGELVDTPSQLDQRASNDHIGSDFSSGRKT